MRILQLFAALLLLFNTDAGHAQDYIITWNDDTLHCRLPSKPQKEGFRPRSEHNSGYLKIAAVFPNDSIRVIKPGEIKGYYRAEHGKRLLCDGQFHSIKVMDTDKKVTDPDGKNDPHTWYFMALDEKGEHASMYKLLIVDRGVKTWYYVVKHKKNKGLVGSVMTTKRQIASFLADEDIAEDMRGFIRKNRSYRKMVKEYNRLKEAAAVPRP